MNIPEHEFFTTSVSDKIAHIRLNRSEKANSLHMPMWEGFVELMAWADATPEVRVVVLSGEGKHFCAGIDLEMFGGLGLQGEDVGRQAESLRQLILKLQDSFNAFERCRKPVITAIHGACVGGGVDLITAADLRYATQDAKFSIKEVDLGMAADVGTLQRLPHLIGASVMRELAFTGRDFLADEALEIGLLNAVLPDKQAMLDQVMEVATQIAAKSPTAIRAIKDNILFARDHSVPEALNYIATWNASQLMSGDLKEAVMAKFEKREPKFED